MYIEVLRKVKVWVRETYDIDNESQVEDAINEDLVCYDLDTLWETQENMGPVEVYDDSDNLIYKNHNE